jgi:PAS domain S-box-containing protein
MGDANEDRRVEALHRLQILDTLPEPAYDRIVQIASRLIGTPIAMITFVDRDRQWCKASVGIEPGESSRASSFCDHVIRQSEDGALVIDDASADPRFADNELVRGEAGIRFYAGQALRAPGGERVGALCVLDRERRSWATVDAEVLHDLAMLVEHLIGQQQLSDVSTALQRSETREALVMETINDGLAIIDADGRIVQWNSAAEHMLGLTPDQMSGRTTSDPLWGAVHSDGTPWTGETHPSVQAMATGLPVRDLVMGINRPGGGLVWLRVNSTPLVEGDGSVSGALTSFADITGIVESDTAHSTTTTNPEPPQEPYDRAVLEQATVAFADALTEASRRIEQEQELLVEVLSDLRAGVPFSETVHRVDMGEGRESLTTAFAGMEVTRRQARVHMFRALLAEGYSIGEIARSWGVSRQLASRLLREAKDAD